MKPEPELLMSPVLMPLPVELITTEPAPLVLNPPERLLLAASILPVETEPKAAVNETLPAVAVRPVPEVLISDVKIVPDEFRLTAFPLPAPVEVVSVPATRMVPTL